MEHGARCNLVVSTGSRGFLLTLSMPSNNKTGLVGEPNGVQANHVLIEVTSA